MKVVIFRSVEPLKLIVKALKKKGHEVFLFNRRLFQLSVEEMKVIETADFYITGGTWGSKHISRQLNEGMNPMSNMNHINNFVEGISVKYNKRVLH